MIQLSRRAEVKTKQAEQENCWDFPGYQYSVTRSSLRGSCCCDILQDKRTGNPKRLRHSHTRRAPLLATRPPAPYKMHLLPAGDVERQQVVGAGGFGVVYRGWSKRLNMEVALKMVQGSRSSNLNKLIRDLKREQSIMQKASSNPHVLQLIGVYGKPEDDLPEHGLVMKYMPNGSLLSLLDKFPDVPWALRFQIFHQVALGMNCLHSLDPPIIHRDLKPSNVLLDKHLDVQITDFGLSKIAGVTSSATPSFAGTWSYMAPEALNDINYRPTKSYDVYSYGILMWRLFSSEEPYHGRDAADIRRLVADGQRPRVSDVDEYSEVKMVPEAKDLMIRCWNQNAENRPSFHDCTVSTAMMFEAYKDEVIDAVRSVENLLNKKPSQDELLDTLEDSSLSAESFIRAFRDDLQINQVKEEPSSGDEKPKDEEPEKDDMTPPEPSEVIHANNDISPAELVMDNIVTVVKESGEYNKIKKMIDNDDILPKELQKQLNSNQSLKALGNIAGKAFLTKYVKNPDMVLSFIKKF
ncbi:receptor-interacting serine/threonine-protein kinase 3-like [Phyllobates terribilis]|uniref:receptor-interacting serine/threonine-protein kinase 3-like n=1 Tax=Phyllobates terribilis TaxID=111132 RepID=UPI003CCA9F75